MSAPARGSSVLPGQVPGELSVHDHEVLVVTRAAGLPVLPQAFQSVVPRAPGKTVAVRASPGIDGRHGDFPAEIVQALRIPPPLLVIMEEAPSDLDHLVLRPAAVLLQLRFEEAPVEHDLLARVPCRSRVREIAHDLAQNRDGVLVTAVVRQRVRLPHPSRGAGFRAGRQNEKRDGHGHDGGGEAAHRTMISLRNSGQEEPFSLAARIAFTRSSGTSGGTGSSGRWHTALQRRIVSAYVFMYATHAGQTARCSSKRSLSCPGSSSSK